MERPLNSVGLEYNPFKMGVVGSSPTRVTQMDNGLLESESHLVTRKDQPKMLLFQFESGCDLFGVKNQITCRDRRQHENCHHYPTHTQDEINLARI